MKNFIIKIACALTLVFGICTAFSQTFHTTNLTVVYSNGQSDSYFENVTQFSFSGGDLLIQQNGTVTPISRSIIRKLTLDDVVSSSIETYEATTGIVVYPNPTSDKLFFATEQEQVVNVKIYSLHGQLLSQTEVNTSEAIDVSFLAKGIYIIKINELSYKFSKL